MNKKQIDKLILIFGILAILSLLYPPVDNFLEKTFSSKQEVFVERIIDGDTIETEIGNIRLLGINTPERGEKYYNEAKEFLENEMLNKTVELEFVGEKYDKYGRLLSYIFIDSLNINIEIVENGFANYYFYGGRDKYSDELEEAWAECIERRINLCEPSNDKCKKCLMVNQDYLINNCDLSCNITNWTIKGEGREKFVFNSTLSQNERINFELDLSDSGGAIFLRDADGKLALWKR